MPRHRQGSVPRHGVPRHRAQRRERPGRGVPDGTAPGRPQGLVSGLLHGRSVRSLLVTPWFAAGMGVLITATLVLESPTDAVLSYGPPAGKPCGAQGCVQPGPKRGHGSLASRPSVQLPPPVRPTSRTRTTAPDQPPRHQASPPAKVTDPPPAVTLSFRVISRDHRGFIAMITMYSPDGLGDWTLGFTIPGAGIRGVGGARWQGGGDSGIAQAQPSPWVRSRSGTRLARFMVFGTGTPGQPTGCTFDGRDCAFS